MWILNYINWNVSPEIFSFGSLQVRYYGLFFATGFMISFYIVQKFYRDAALDPNEVDKLTIYTVIGAILGSRLGHVFFYEPQYYLQNPSEILMVWHGGLASHGGAIGIIISTYFYSVKQKRNYLWLLDRIAIPTALTGGLIRLGNLMNSEIYGHETSLPWGFIFERNMETTAKHPTQIYEALAYFTLFGILWMYYQNQKAKPYNGKILGLFFIITFGFRFIVEFIKNDQVIQEKDMLINIGQWLSIPVVIAGFFLFYRKSTHNTYQILQNNE
jgi:prolipoprotein diacylglyceryl transferase